MNILSRLSILLILITSMISLTYASSTTTTYDITVPIPVNVAYSGYAIEGSLMSEYGINFGAYIGNSLDNVKIHSFTKNGKYFCNMPKVDGKYMSNHLIATKDPRDRIVYGNVRMLGGGDPRTFLAYPWQKGIHGIIGTENIQGIVSPYIISLIDHLYGYMNCSYSGNTLPTPDIQKVTYNIRLQYPLGQKVTFVERFLKNKSYDLAKSTLHDIVLYYNMFPTYSYSDRWAIDTVARQTLDKKTVDYMSGYLNIANPGAEGFAVPSDTEIISLTFKRK